MDIFTRKDRGSSHFSQTCFCKGLIEFFFSVLRTIYEISGHLAELSKLLKLPLHRRNGKQRVLSLQPVKRVKRGFENKYYFPDLTLRLENKKIQLWSPRGALT